MPPGARKRFSLVLSLGSSSPTSPLSSQSSSAATPSLASEGRSPLTALHQSNTPVPSVPAARPHKLIKRDRQGQTADRRPDGGENTVVHSRQNSSVIPSLDVDNDPCSSLGMVHIPNMTFSPSDPISPSFSNFSLSSMEPLLASSDPSLASGTSDMLQNHRLSLAPSTVSSNINSTLDDGMSVISGIAVPLQPAEAGAKRIAKLTRTFGETVTADLLSGSSVNLHSTPPKSMRKRGTNMVRRLSLDMTTLMSPTYAKRGRDAASPSSSALSPTDSTTPLKSADTATMKRSRSLWTRRRDTSTGPKGPSQTRSSPGEVTVHPDIPENQWMASAGPKLRPISPPIPERQRVLNVKRAKKMNDLFGSEPPLALFQIKHLDFEVPMTPLTPTRRASIGTFFAEDGLRTPTSDKRSSRLTGNSHRSSTLTIVSLSSSDARLSRRHSSVHSLPTPEDLMMGENSQPVSPRRSQFPAPVGSIRHLATTLPAEPPSPPPFLHIRSETAPAPSAPAPTPPRVESDDLWTRRKRAQKLGQFFGVETREIPALCAGSHPPAAAEAPAPQAPPPRALSPGPGALLASASSCDDSEESDVRVDVKLGGTRLWGFRREPDMQKAMVTLREMRAS